VYYQEKCGTIQFQIFKYVGLVLSIKTDVLLVQINTALNREGVELPINQSYLFEVTTVPFGLHYITSYEGSNFLTIYRVLFVSENWSNAHRENPYSLNPVNHTTYTHGIKPQPTLHIFRFEAENKSEF
jgi:hypothetical protein